MAARFGVILLDGSGQPSDILERPVIHLGYLAALGVHIVQPLKLDQPDGRIQIVHVIFVAEIGNFIVPAVAGLLASLPCVFVDATPTQTPQLCGQPFIVGRYHAAVASRQILDRMKTETYAVAIPAYHPCRKHRATRMGSIFDYLAMIQRLDRQPRLS